MDNDELDRVLGAVPSDAAPPGPCPDDGVLLDYVRGEFVATPAFGREQLEEHLARCSQCREMVLALQHPVDPETLARGMETVLGSSTPSLPPGSRERRIDWRRYGGWGAGLATAATVLWVVGVVGTPTARGPGSVGGGADSPLPAYTLEGPHGGVKTHRSGTHPSQVFFDAHARVRFVVRPHRAVDSNPRLYGWVQRMGESQNRWRRVELGGVVEERGGFEVAVPARDLFAASGEFHLRLAVVPRGVEVRAGEWLSSDLEALGDGEGRWLPPMTVSYGVDDDVQKE